MAKCPICGYVEITPDASSIIKILELLDQNPNSTRKEIHDMLGGTKILSTTKLYHIFEKLENAGFLSDVGQAKDISNKKITESHQFGSRVYVSNVRIIRKG